MKIDEGLKTFWNVVEQMQHAADRRQPIHQVEETIFRDLLVIGNWLLQAFLDMAGTGDVGPTLRVASDSPSDLDQQLPRLEQPHQRPYLSIFGEVAIQRTCYGEDRVEAAPLDAQLHLPQRQYSYLLQQWLGSFVVDDAHAEAIRKLETILGLEITVRASEDLNREQASDVEVFSRPPSGSGRRRGRTALGGDSGLQRGTPGAQGATAGRGDRPPCHPGEPAPWPGREGEQEEDGGGVDDRAVGANGRRCDRGSDNETRQAACPGRYTFRDMPPGSGAGRVTA